MNLVKLCFTSLLAILSFDVFSQTGCDEYLNKFQMIQAKQRAGYSASQGERLKKQAQISYDKWWRCKRGKLKKVKAAKQQIAKGVPRKKANIRSNATVKSLTNNITIKAKYRGKQQQAWLNFYQPKPACKSPKTLSLFAKCRQDERRQQTLFEQSY